MFVSQIGGQDPSLKLMFVVLLVRGRDCPCSVSVLNQVQDDFAHMCVFSPIGSLANVKIGLGIEHFTNRKW